MLASMAHKLVLRKLFKVPNSVSNLWRHYDAQNPDEDVNYWFWTINQHSQSSAWDVLQDSTSTAGWGNDGKGYQGDVLVCASLIL